jgi:hypothetical protein
MAESTVIQHITGKLTTFTLFFQRKLTLALLRLDFALLDIDPPNLSIDGVALALGDTL